MAKHNLIKKLSISIASLALICPLTMSGLNNTNVNARRRHIRTHRVYRYHNHYRRTNHKNRKAFRKSRNKRTRRTRRHKNYKRINRKYYSKKNRNHKRVIRRHMSRKYNARHMKSMKRKNKKHVVRKHSSVNTNNSTSDSPKGDPNPNDIGHPWAIMHSKGFTGIPDETDTTEQENDDTPFNEKALDKAVDADEGYLAQENGYNSDWSTPKNFYVEKP